MSDYSKVLRLSSNFDRRINFNPYNGPNFPSYQRRHLLNFSTTPPPVLTIPQEILARLTPILHKTSDVTKETQALKEEYSFYYEQKVSKETKEKIQSAFKTEAEDTPKSTDTESNILKIITGESKAPPEWEELQRSYKATMQQLQNKPGGCTACEKNSVIQKYRGLIEKLLKTKSG